MARADDHVLNRYGQIIQHIFRAKYKKGATEVDFERDDLTNAAAALKIKLPKNLGDILYTFRYRGVLPEAVVETAPEGMHWIIRGRGRGQYRFSLATQQHIVPNPSFLEIKVPESTPGIIAKYALDDEQALLAKLRYNRLIDVFTGVTCYSLQNHLRTSVPLVGQVETDEIYLGLDRRGVHYVFPVQAKGGRDKINVVQIEQDLAMCQEKFPQLICRPIAAQFMSQGLIALFECTVSEGKIAIVSEKHYLLVRPEELSPEELRTYATPSE